MEDGTVFPSNQLNLSYHADQEISRNMLRRLHYEGEKTGEKYKLLESQQMGSEVSLPFLYAKLLPYILPMSLDRPRG